MIVPLVLLIGSLVGVGAAVFIPALSDLILIAAPCALASFFLLIREYLSGAPTGISGRRPRNISRQEFKNRRQDFLVIDGSNAMYWKDGTPQLETVRELVLHLSSLGYTPGVVFDANAGYLVSGKYLHDRAMENLLGLPRDRVIVVPKGEPADIKILEAARFLGARVVTNDQYRDWADVHPEIGLPGFLIKGDYREGKVWVDLGKSQKFQ